MEEIVKKEQASMNDIFLYLKAKSNSLYKFVILYNEFINKPKDYGTGELINMVEVHILTAIEENPGISPTQLAKIWNRTKGAISQTISKLEKKGYITKEKKEGNAKTILLYPTISGVELSKAHKLYDTIDVTRTFEYLIKECTLEEIDSFYKVIDLFINLLEESPQENNDSEKV
ncbi:TPA: MarR family transcriptional regulator [Clostridioides difficile]|nr:MarR family transcriptional regulator [Clostridioides difficile]